jgi:hypothetical protein
VEFLRSQLAAGSAVTRIGAGAGRGAFGVLRVAAAVPARVGRTAEHALLQLEHIAGGVQAMHGEFVGMREDIRGLDAGVAGLREEVAGLRGDVGRVEANTKSLDPRLEKLGTSLESVDLLTMRLARFGQRRGAQGDGLRGR